MRPDPLRLVRVAALLLVALLVPAGRAAAQDSQYWSITYGPVGQLVGGQVIGGVPDLSATYYNPGALALRNESNYLLSTESVQWERLSTQAQPGLEILDTSSSTFGAAPSLIAGILPRWLGEQTRLAWSYLTRQQLDVQLGQRLTNPLSSPWQASAAETYFDQSVSEGWGGLTFARPLSPSLGLGLTWYGVYRGQQTRSEASAQGVAAGDRSFAVSGVTAFDYWHVRTLAKLGLAWQSNEWKAGLSLTTPSLALFGGGDAAYTISLAGMDANADGRPDPAFLATETADGLAIDYRSSWAIGAGASKSVGPARLYVSAEWFAPVSRFTVIALPEASTQAGQLTQELGSVLNGGVAFEYTLSEAVSVHGAFHTDFSASVGGSEANVAVSDWDLYHFSGGASFRIRDNRFTLGVLWARGGQTRPLDTPLPPEDVPGIGLDRPVEIRYSKITFLLGLEFGR